ncbi:HEAT repeat domain-containing protein [Streptomyces sp. LZ34]
MSEAIDALVRDLSDKDRTVRRAAEDGLVALGAQSVDRLLPYVRDTRRESPRFSAESVLKRLGDQALPRLREIRRHGPGQLRGKALEALVDLGGAEALDDADRRAVERLVRVKLLDELEVSLPLDGGRWLAFPADRFDDAVSVLGLHDLRPATTVMGVEAATRATDSMEFQDSQGEKRRAYRVFITPEFENWREDPPIRNWRMVWGNSFVDELDGFMLADKLSERCGEAHFYVLDPYHSGSSWYVAHNGRRVRSCHNYDDHPQFWGKPLLFEIDSIKDAAEGLEDEEYAKGVPHADVAADNLSAQPGPMSEDHTHGHGWLATTHPDLPNSRFKGALPI